MPGGKVEVAQSVLNEPAAALVAAIGAPEAKPLSAEERAALLKTLTEQHATFTTIEDDAGTE